MEAATTNGSQSETTRAPRPYVVLEQSTLLDAINALFKKADIGLATDEWDRLDEATKDAAPIYTEVARVPSRNSAHALTQVGSQYEAEGVKPLVAVSERMFRPRKVNVSFDPRVSLS